MSPTRRRVFVAGALAAGAAGAWALSRRPRAEEIGLEAACQSAARVGAPAAVLLALAHADSRGARIRLGEDGVGWIHLSEGREFRSPNRAAQILGVPARELRRSPKGGVKAAAALFAVAARNTGIGASSPLHVYGEALERFHGGHALARRLYADGVLRLLRDGFAHRDDLGQPYSASAHPDIVLEAPLSAPPTGLVGARFVRHHPAGAGAAGAIGGRAVSHVVIHSTEARFGDVVTTFGAGDATVASHYVIRSQDGLIAQMVDERAEAHHARCFNETTIGIEHEGYAASGGAWFSDKMYAASAKLVADIAARHRIPLDREHVLGHVDAPDCSDHVDPGPSWDWNGYLTAVKRERRR